MFDGLSLYGLLILAIVLIVVELLAVIVIAGHVASYFGFTGLMWWAVAIVSFIVINGIIGLFLRL